MKLHALFTEEDALSSVIGTVLMVAVVVILAAVLGVFVFDLSGNLNPGVPQAGFDISYNVTVGGGANSTTFEMSSGGEIETKRLYVLVDGDRAWSGTGGAQTGFNETSGWGTDTISSGDSLTIAEDPAGSGEIAAGDEVGIYWRSEEKSTVLTKTTIAA